MATLLLRLAAPLQSWGADSKFETRRTNREPTKSGVIGMLAAAMGIKRNQDQEIEKLNKLKFGVRVDKEGELLVDFHMAKNPEKKNADYLTYRHYLQDAVFLVGLECNDEAVLKELLDAIEHPAFPLYLGRRSCPPTLPICLGIRKQNLEDALREEAELCSNNSAFTRIVTDAEPRERSIAIQKDVTISLNQKHRQYGYRSVKEIMISNGSDAQKSTDHDPFAEL